MELSQCYRDEKTWIQIVAGIIVIRGHGIPAAAWKYNGRKGDPMMEQAERGEDRAEK
jgi:hypothetical protein